MKANASATKTDKDPNADDGKRAAHERETKREEEWKDAKIEQKRDDNWGSLRRKGSDIT